MKRIRRKLNSRKGASITFALLLFLVCAVLSSVIIVAATAASGRMSKIAESDQRYYAVTSAAELLKDVFKEHPTVSVVEVIETHITTKYTDGVAVLPATETSLTKVYIVADKKAAEISDSDLTAANMIGDSGFSIDTIQKDAAIKVYNGTPDTSGKLLNKRKLDFTSNFTKDVGLDYDTLAVTIEEDLYENGILIMTLYNRYKDKGSGSSATESGAGSRYTLGMTFGADKSVTTNTKTEHVSYIFIDDRSYEETTKKIETTITTLTWTLVGIKTNA